VQGKSPTNYSPANTSLPEATKYSGKAPDKWQGLKAKGIYQGVGERKEEMFNTQHISILEELRENFLALNKIYMHSYI